MVEDTSGMNKDLNNTLSQITSKLNRTYDAKAHRDRKIQKQAEQTSEPEVIEATVIESTAEEPEQSAPIEEPKRRSGITMRKKTTETLEIENDYFECEIIKNIIVEDDTQHVELDSVQIKHITEDGRTGKSLVKLKGPEAQGFLDIAMQVAGVFAPRNYDNTGPVYVSPNPPPAQQTVVHTEAGEAVFLQEPVNRPQTASMGVDPTQLAMKRLEQVHSRQLQNGMSPPANVQGDNPYVQSQLYRQSDQTLSQQAGITEGLTEDQLTPEQRAYIQERYQRDMEMMYKQNQQRNQPPPPPPPTTSGPAAQVNNPNSPPTRRGPSRLKQQRMHKLHGGQ